MRQRAARGWIATLVLMAACSDDTTGPDAGAKGSIVDSETAAALVDVASETAAQDSDSGTEADVAVAPEDVVVADANEVLDIVSEPEIAPSLDVLGDAVASGAEVQPADIGPDAATAPDGKPDATCTPPPQYSYTCDAKVPSTCPGGACLFGMCIGPQLDPKRWDACGDGKCDPCEPTCPADCGPKPVFSGSKQFSGDKTLTVWVHGFSNQGKDKLAKLTYGDVKGCGDVLQTMQAFGINRPCGNTAATEKDPNQLIAVEYYGTVPPGWMSKQDVDEVEKFPFSGGPLGLQRYARIVAKFAKWRMLLSGATHVQFACHSMGCLITRHLIENDEEKLASSNQIVRWSTSTGVVAGAKLSRLFNNPTVQQASAQIGLELSDFILMNPDYVWDTTVAWDHKLHEANNPLFTGMLLHHVGATKPQIAEALNIALLDLLGGGNEPNDGIMYTEDMHFWSQDPKVAAKSLAGDAVPPGLTLVHVDHMTCPGTEAAGLLATAALFHKRKVEVRLVSFQLIDDREKDNLLDAKENGMPPAEVVIETQARYNPFVLNTFKKDVLVSDDRMATRTAPLWTQDQGTTKTVNQLVYAAPVLDGMDALWLSLNLIESDWYPRYKVNEWAFDDSNELVAFVGSVPLKDGHTFEAASKFGIAKFLVRVHTMY